METDIRPGELAKTLVLEELQGFHTECENLNRKICVLDAKLEKAKEAAKIAREEFEDARRELSDYISEFNRELPLIDGAAS